MKLWQWLVTFAGAASVASWAALPAVRSWRRYRAGVGKPLLHGITDSQLERLPTQWVLRAKRWPPPNPGSPGVVMSRPAACAYAMLADTAAARAKILAEVLIVLGGAWLGTTITDIVATLREAGERSASAGVDWPPAILRVDAWEGIVHFLPVFVLTAGFTTLYTWASWYAEAASAYRAVADHEEGEPLPVQQVVPEQGPLKRFLGGWMPPR